MKSIKAAIVLISISSIGLVLSVSSSEAKEKTPEPLPPLPSCYEECEIKFSKEVKNCNGVSECIAYVRHAAVNCLNKCPMPPAESSPDAGKD